MPNARGVLVIALVAGSSIAGTARAQEPATGVITTVAGTGTHGYTGDGAPANEARLSNPYGVAFDAAGNIYIADQTNHRIRKVTAATGVITTIGGDGTGGFAGDGGPATAAKINSPSAVAVDAAGDIYISDRHNYRIRRISAATGVITTVAGSGVQGYAGDGGPATAAQLNYAIAITLDASGNLYIADQNNHRVRVVVAATGVITTMAGSGTLGYDGDGGPATSAKLNAPAGVAVDGSGNVYIADGANHRVRKVTAATGIITTAAGTATGGYAGENVPATTAQLYYPRGLATDAAGNVYIVDAGDNRVRKIIVATGKIITVVGNGIAGDGGDTGQAPAARLYDPTAVAVDGSGRIYVADKGNARIRKVGAPTPTLQMTTLAGTGVAGYDGDGGPGPSAELNYPRGVAVDVAGNVYIADYSNHRVRRVAAATGVVTTFAGTAVSGFQGDGGPATAAHLNGPSGLAIDAAGNVFIADSSNNRVRKVSAATGVITTVAGSGTTGAAATAAPRRARN